MFEKYSCHILEISLSKLHSREFHYSATITHGYNNGSWGKKSALLMLSLQPLRWLSGFPAFQTHPLLCNPKLPPIDFLPIHQDLHRLCILEQNKEIQLVVNHINLWWHINYCLPNSADISGVPTDYINLLNSSPTTYRYSITKLPDAHSS